MQKTTKKSKRVGYGGALYMAPRLEGVVKNRGIKPRKKERKDKKG